MFLAGSGVSGFDAPVFFLGSGMGARKMGAYASYGMTTDGRYVGGAGGVALAKTGVPAKRDVASVKATAVCFI